MYACKRGRSISSFFFFYISRSLSFRYPRILACTYSSLYLLSVKNPQRVSVRRFFQLRLLVKEKEGGGGDGGLCCMESLVSGLGKDRTGCV